LKIKHPYWPLCCLSFGFFGTWWIQVFSNEFN